MNFLPTSLAAVACLLAATTFSQDGGPAPERPKPTAKRSVSMDQLLGAWHLTDFESPTMRRERRQEAGYLLIAPDFLSFECHFGWNDAFGAREARVFFTGTHSYVLRADGVLELSALIGTTIDPNGSSPVFEPPGRKREYKVKLDGPKLVLSREVDPQTFTFERLASNNDQLDFYGRRKKPSGGEDK